MSSNYIRKTGNEVEGFLEETNHGGEGCDPAGFHGDYSPCLLLPFCGHQAYAAKLCCQMCRLNHSLLFPLYVNGYENKYITSAYSCPVDTNQNWEDLT